MIKIGICDVAPQSACSYYRSFGPLSKLKYLDASITTEHIPSIAWNTLLDIDILFLARPCTDNYLQSLRVAQSFGIPTWIDFDDLLAKVPDYNDHNGLFKQESTQKIINECISQATIVTVSTQAIKDYYFNLNPNIIVIPNAFNDYNFDFNLVSVKNDFITWRGSDTHRADILSIAAQMFNIARTHTDWKWIFIGNNLWYITEQIKNVLNAREMDTIDYFKYIESLKSAIWISPLVNNEFNISKSNCGWIEGTYSGAVTIAPPLPEFIKPGIINYDTAEKFEYSIEKLMNSKSYREANYIKSYDYISKNLLLSIVNQQRLNIIKSVLKG
jgi:hypothetical protein